MKRGRWSDLIYLLYNKHIFDMSSVERAVEDMNYLFCPRNSHGEELSMVCLEKKCLRSLLICPICEIEEHENHQVVPLRNYLYQAFCKKGDSGKAVLQHIQEVESMKEGIRREVSGLREDFLSSLYELENNAIDYFNKIAEKFMEISTLNS